MLIIVFCVFIFNSFTNSGCLFYPIKQTCLDKQTISWSANYNEILEEKIVAEAWAKGFYHQKKEERISSQKKYVQFLNWFPNWFRIHFVSKIIEQLLRTTIGYYTTSNMIHGTLATCCYLISSVFKSPA